MKLLRNIFVVLAGLVVFGLAKAPFEKRLEARMQQKRLLPEPIALDTWEELGQTSLAISLGGLRSMIAPMLNIGAHVHWSNQKWYELEQSYYTIVALQPNTRYYWIAAGWHLRSNAYADYQDKPGIPDGLRKRKQREFFDKGIAFLERGIATNPNDARLHAELGNALSEIWRPRDLERAAQAYRAAFELSGNLQAQRQHVYCLSRLPGREEEAWKYAQEMWSIEPNRKYISPRTIFYALQNWADPPAAERIALEDIFTSRYGRPSTFEERRREAAVDFADYWFRQDQGFPTYGVREIIEELCKELDAIPELHPLQFEPDQTFSIHPVTGQSFGTDRVTGKPRRKSWRSIWMDSLRSAYRSHLTSPPRSLLTFPILWFKLEEGYSIPRLPLEIEKLYRQFQIPEVFHPLRHQPHDLVSEDPLTGQPFETDPATGRPTEREWRVVWMKIVRKALLEWLESRNR